MITRVDPVTLLRKALEDLIGFSENTAIDSIEHQWAINRGHEAMRATCNAGAVTDRSQTPAVAYRWKYDVNQRWIYGEHLPKGDHWKPYKSLFASEKLYTRPAPASSSAVEGGAPVYQISNPTVELTWKDVSKSYYEAFNSEARLKRIVYPAAPAASPAVLTDADIDQMARRASLDGSMCVGPRSDYWRNFARDIERHITGQAGGEPKGYGDVVEGGA